MEQNGEIGVEERPAHPAAHQGEIVGTSRFSRTQPAMCGRDYLDAEKSLRKGKLGNCARGGYLRYSCRAYGAQRRRS